MLVELKEILDIDWDTDDARLERVISRAKNHIKQLLDVENLDTDNDEDLRNLVFNCARYEYNNVIELFDSNFAGEIYTAQVKAGINALKNAKAEAGK